MRPSVSHHRQNYISVLTENIFQVVDNESLPFYSAAPRVALEWLGYDLDDVTFVDSQDRGIDAWLSTEVGIEIFQFKTHQPTETGSLELAKFDNRGINDISRAQQFLLYEQLKNVKRKELGDLLYYWRDAIRSRKIQNDGLAVPVTLYLILLGDGLTETAAQELSTLQQQIINQPYDDEGVPIQFNIVLHTIDDIVDARWREENRKWEDANGQSVEYIDLYPASGNFISDQDSAVFYCRAIDLVNAYSVLGYQLFEPNVRANIKKSRVNKAIRDSVSRQRSRKEFRFLNNGVTMTCDHFNKPREQRDYFKVKHPGVVNGLQTVVALHTAYDDLDPAQKSDFEKNCYVLVRILRNDAVNDINQVVKATNNQNPMRPRNLVSNNLEQLNYARLFAELGWFYEAKQGAWDAFDKDNRRWRPDLKKRSQDFRVTNGRKIRRIDNERLAQVWLAFIGFSPEAVNRKKELFDDRFYSIIFKQQLRKHGTLYKGFSEASQDTVEQAPGHYLMLIAYLARDFAQSITLTAPQNRQNACDRLKINQTTISKAELDVLLSKDDDFTLNQALSGMSMLFVEFIGYVLYHALGDEMSELGYRIFQNHSFYALATDYSVEVVRKRIETENFELDDLLIVLWLAFVDIINDMLLGGWGQSYRAAAIKVRFIFSDATRSLLYREIDEKDNFMKRRTLTKLWASGVKEKQGCFDFIKEICVS